MGGEGGKGQGWYGGREGRARAGMEGGRKGGRRWREGLGLGRRDVAREEGRRGEGDGGKALGWGGEM